MTVTSATCSKLIGLACLLTALAAFGQDAADEIEPAVDTSAPAVEEQVAAPAADTADAERDAAEPAVSGPALAQDVTRREAAGGVMDEITLGRTEITGNQELPKVLYIVPWQKAEPGDLTGRPVNTLLDEVLAPLDREEFNRQVDYYDELYGDK